MEFRNLNTFLKIAETGNFSRAAEQLMYSQSTVTTQIQQLEEELNVRLFERLGKKVYLTEKGKELLEYAQQTAVLMQKMSQIGKEKEELEGSLSIVSFDSLTTTLLPPLLLEYHKRHPKVTFMLKSTYSIAEAVQFLAKNEADIGMFFRDGPEEQSGITFFSEKHHYIFACRSGHPLAEKENVSLEELQKEDIIVTCMYTIAYEFLNRHFKDLERKLNPFLDIWNTPAIPEFLKRSDSISLIPDYLVKEAIQKGELAVLNVPEVHIPFWIQVVYHQNKTVTPQMSAFFELLHEFYDK